MCRFSKNLSSFYERVSLLELVKEPIIEHQIKNKFQCHKDFINKMKGGQKTFQEEDLEIGLLWCSYCMSDHHYKFSLHKTRALKEHARILAHQMLFCCKNEIKMASKYMFPKERVLKV